MKHKFLTRMQNGVLALGLATLLFSCSKEEILDAPSLSLEPSEKIALTFRDKTKGNENFKVKEGVNACAEKTVDLIVGQKAGLGEVSIYKDATKLYVTLSIHDNDNAWFIAKSNLFAGLISDLGVKKNPAPGQFPYSAEIISNNNTGDKEYTYEFNLADFEGKGTLSFAVFADLVRVKTDDNGDIVFDGEGMAEIVQKEGAWGDGVRFTDKGSWAMYTPYDVDQVCNVSCDPVWTGLSGGLTRTQGALNMEPEDISYLFFLDGEAVGKVELTYTPSGNVNTTFNLDQAYSDLSFDEIAVKVSNSVVNNDFSNVDKVTSPNDKGEWKVELKDFSGTIYAAFYAKVNGVCR